MVNSDTHSRGVDEGVTGKTAKVRPGQSWPHGQGSPHIDCWDLRTGCQRKVMGPPVQRHMELREANLPSTGPEAGWVEAWPLHSGWGAPQGCELQPSPFTASHQNTLREHWGVVQWYSAC
jgi:hypothetical protein